MEQEHDNTDQSPVVQVAVDALSTVGSPRTSGENHEHVQALVAAGDVLPPIVVHRSTMRVIDGVHRLRAAQLRGLPTIAVRFFDGTEADAFVLAVRSNSAHGLPLSLADRKQAAARIVTTHPHLSARMVASMVGVAPGTVGEIRRKVLGATSVGEVRVGRDGKVRPTNGAEGRRIVTELINENPDLSLRQIARIAGVSPETVRTVRKRLAAARTLEEGDGDAPAAGPLVPSARRGGAFSTEVVLAREQDQAAILERLRADPALRFSENGRDLLRLLHTHTVMFEQWDRLLASVPPRCRSTVAELARECARTWAEFAERVAEKATATAS